MGINQSSEEDIFEGATPNSGTPSGRGRRRRGLNLIVKDMKPLGDGCFRAVGMNGFVHLLANRGSSLFTFVAYLESQRARQGYENLIMEKRHLASLCRLEPINEPRAAPQMLHLPSEEQKKEKDKTEDTDLEGQPSDDDEDDEDEDANIEILENGYDHNVSAATSLTFTPPPLENIPLLASPFITGTPHLGGYDELMAFRKVEIPGEFFWIRGLELELFQLLTKSRIGETFFMRICKEYMLECETSPQTREISLETHIRQNELCPYAEFATIPKKTFGNKNRGNGLAASSSSSSSSSKSRRKVTPEDAVRQVLRGYEAFEGSSKASIFTDQLLMVFISVQKLLQNTIESHNAVETQTASFEIKYAVLKEIKTLMDEVKLNLQDSYLHKNCPFEPEDVSKVQSPIILDTNNKNNMIMINVGNSPSLPTTPLPPPPQSVSMNTVYEMNPYKKD